MRFWWPDWQPRERSPSSDSECSTASHSSLASDASFYSAAGDGAGAAAQATARAGADPLGLRLRIVDPPAPVLGSAEPEMDPADPPRALPLLGTGAAAGAATSGTGPGPAAPIARQPAARLAPAAAQASLRSAASPSRRFATDASGRRPAGLPRDGPGPDTLAPSMPGSLHAQASQGPGTDEDGAADNAAAQDAAQGASSCAAPRPPPDPNARRLAAQDPPPARPPAAATQLSPVEVAPPGRAGGMLPVPVVPGAELAAATTRRTTPAATTTGSTALPTPAAAPKTPRMLLADPAGRPAGCPLVERLEPMRLALPRPATQPSSITTTQTATPPPLHPAPIPFPFAPPSSPAAAAAASHVAAAAAAHAAPTADRAAPEHRGRAAPTPDHETQARALTEPSSSDAISSGDSSTQALSSGDDGDIGASDDRPGDVAAVPMDVDQGARRPTVGSQPLSPPPVLRIGGKRRRLNDVDDEDTRELAELLLEEEDEAGDQAPAPRLSAASARPASVLSVYAHNAQRFQCTLCAYTAASFASLKRHRDSRHRRTAFLDRFSAGCACGVPFASRLAAANHAHACASLNSTTSAAAAPAAGELSPTAGAANATVMAAIVTPDFPRQDPPELAASPPLASSTHVADQDQVQAEQQPRARWGPPLPRALVAGRVAARLSEVPAPRWGPPLPRDVVASRIAHRLLPPEPASDEETKDNDRQDQPATEMDVDSGVVGEWLLRFDGACRANPGPGGAGAALFKPDGSVVWTCSHYMPSSSETNNTAEYTALLLGTRAAADHGATTLRVEGDSTLVIQQVRGIFATRSTTLRRLRDQVKSELARVGSFSLHHIDRQANAHADRLANRALDLQRTVLECGTHTDGAGCTRTATADTTSSPDQQPPRAPLPPPTADIAMEDPDDDDLAEPADIDDGEVYAAMRVGPGATPQRRPRLQLRKLSDGEDEAARALVERLGASLAAKITDACDWDTAEGYITALPHLFASSTHAANATIGSGTSSRNGDRNSGRTAMRTRRQDDDGDNAADARAQQRGNDGSGHPG
ncbi:hypothetical protein PR002_g4801 [Phytophthora rubi]|uniref:RNase H type-1 domain-containing protein n=2 Tax=Phytophthora rubi TaxID=129364 RepID=A0A6A3NBD1_9STRA|nr:hypothetical protein PR002_g4801 [Phytophthora rubi]